MDLDLCEGIELGDLDELDEEEKADAMAAMGYETRGGDFADLDAAVTKGMPRSKVVCAAVYAGLNASVVYLLAAVEGTDLEDLRSRGAIELYCFVAVASLFFALTLGSDPGYVESGGLEEPPTSDEYRQRKDEAAAATAAILASVARNEECFSTLMPWPDWPPMRAAHCRVTQRWVYTFDHYCPVLGTAIGEKNRGRFWLFLTAQTLALSRAAGAAEAAVHWSDVSRGLETPLVLTLGLWLIFLIVFALWVFHCFLLLANMTSNEFMRSASIDYLQNTEDFDLPFSRGVRGNVGVVFAQDGLLARLRARDWQPIPWVRAAFVNRDSQDWWNNPWQNRYWSCC